MDVNGGEMGVNHSYLFDQTCLSAEEVLMGCLAQVATCWLVSQWARSPPLIYLASVSNV